MKNLPIIIDDFFDDPHHIRKIALDLLKEKHSCIMNDNGSNYPGIRCLVPDDINEYLISSLETQIGKKVNQFNASFHITSAIHKCGLIHQDNEGLAGLIYLNENPPENSGTILCECLNENGYKNVDAFPIASTTRNANIIKFFGEWKQNFNHDNFKITQTIDNKFNRFILYNGQTHHAPHNYFGNNIFNSRLVLVFWVNYEMEN